jgi:DNA-binding CsgD family transcriptional regulator
MQNIDKKASILRAVASGKTLKEAGAEAGIGAEQAVNHLSRICRAIDLRYDLSTDEEPAES